MMNSAQSWTIIWEPCRLCRIRNRTGSWIVAGMTFCSHLIVLFEIVLGLYDFSDIFNIPYGGQQAMLLHTAVYILLCLSLLYGIYLNNIYFCLPWTIYSGLSLLLYTVGLIFLGIHGFTVDAKSTAYAKAGTFIAIYLLFALQVYMFWVVLSYVMELKDKKSNYEHLPDVESRSGSRKRKSRSPVFKIRGDDK